MPRNGSGTFTLAQPAFTPGTTISSTAVNSDLSDIATGLTGSISTDGQTTVTGAIKFANGTTAAPSITFASETTSGWYWSAIHTINLAVNGADVISATTTGLTFTGSLTFSGALNEGEVTVASAATTNIGAAAGNYLLISGTVTITAFDTITAGAERTLEFQGILTLTNGVNLILPGGANIQTAAGDVAKFRSEGAGKWRCVTYLRAGPPLPAANSNPFNGFSPINLQLNASVGSNLLTVAVKDSAGNDPTVASPVWIPFNDSTLTSGDPVWVQVTAALSINTNSTGATLGSSNSTPFRFWIVAFNNGGTVVLGLINCSISTQVFPLNEGALQSSTAISGGATSAGVYYTLNGTTVTSKAIKILGYLEYSTGLGTAGTYGTGPQLVRLFGPGVKKPGDVVQAIYATNGTELDSTSSTFASTSLTASITPTSTVNLIYYTVAGGNIRNAGSGTNAAFAQLFRGATAVGPIVSNGGGAIIISPAAIQGIDAPGSTSSTTYTVKLKNSDNATQVNWNFTTGGWASTTSTMVLQELMG